MPAAGSTRCRGSGADATGPAPRCRHRRFTGAGTGHSRTVPGSDTQSRVRRTRRSSGAWPLLGGAVAGGCRPARSVATPGRRRPRTGRPSSWSPGCSWSASSPTEDGLFAAGGHALARVAPNGLALYAGTVAPRRHGDDAAQPRHVGHVPDPGARLRRPQPGRGRGRPPVRAACCSPTRARCCCPVRT